MHLGALCPVSHGISPPHNHWRSSFIKVRSWFPNTQHIITLTSLKLSFSMYTSIESIEISASPEDVRKKVIYEVFCPFNTILLFRKHSLRSISNSIQFLDFSSLQKYHPNGFFKSISTDPPNQPLEPGVKMCNVLELMTVHASIAVCPLLLCNTWKT
jgi:hypothetical protein